MFRKVPLFLLLLYTSFGVAQQTRHLTFHYGFTVKDVPAGRKIRLWFPAAHSDVFQTVKVNSATGDLSLKKTHESKFENEMYYAENSNPKQRELHFEVVYDVVRRERITLGVYSPHLEAVKIPDRERKQYLAPDVLVPTTGLPAELAVKVTEGKGTPLNKARGYTTTFSQPYATTRAAPVGDAVTCSTLATPRRVTVPTFIPYSSPWRALREFQRALRSGFLCHRTSIRQRSPDITVGQISSSHSTVGFRLTFPRLGSTRRRKTTSSARTTPTACSSRWGGILS